MQPFYPEEDFPISFTYSFFTLHTASASVLTVPEMPAPHNIGKQKCTGKGSDESKHQSHGKAHLVKHDQKAHGRCHDQYDCEHPEQIKYGVFLIFHEKGGKAIAHLYQGNIGTQHKVYGEGRYQPHQKGLKCQLMEMLLQSDLEENFFFSDELDTAALYRSPPLGYTMQLRI